MICLYESNATDFTTLGLAVLQPTECTVTERAAGMYELEMVHPITDDDKASMLTCGRIIKAPTPTRESPEIEYDQSGGTAQTVTRRIYKVNVTTYLYIRKTPSNSGAKIGTLKNNAEVMKIAETQDASQNTWYKIATMDGGTTGYVFASYLVDTGTTKTITIGEDIPTHVITTLTLSKTQLFRIYSCERSSENRNVTVRARHVTYDLAGVYCRGNYGEDVTIAQHLNYFRTVSGERPMFSHLTDIDIKAYGFDGVTVKMTYTEKNVMELILGDDNSIVSETNARIVRDNFNLYIIPPASRELGYEIRYGKNLLMANLKQDTSNTITSVIGKWTDSNGDVHYSRPTISSTSGAAERLATYGRINSIIDYGTRASENATISAIGNDFANNLLDYPTVTLDTEFVALELAPRYAELANQYAMHMYDVVRVYDPEAQIDMKVSMSEYTFDVLTQKYTSVTLGTPEEISFGGSGDTTIVSHSGGSGIAVERIANADIDTIFS